MAGFLLFSSYVPDGGYKNAIYQTFGNYPGGYRHLWNRGWLLLVPPDRG